MNKQCWFAMLIAIAGFCINTEPTKAANGGNGDAKLELGKSHADGPNVKMSLAEAMEVLRTVADPGYAEARFRLGLNYATGTGVEKNDAEAVKWYCKAAGQGDSIAQYILATRYAYGLGVATNYLEAAKWYELVAEQHCVRGEMGKIMIDVCQFYAEEDIKAATDIEKAMPEVIGGGFLGCVANKEAEKIIMERKHRLMVADFITERTPHPARAVGDIYSKGGWGIEKNESEAVKWYRKAAENGDDKSMLALGDVYFYGRGVEKDTSETVKWYRKAAERGVVEAQYWLGWSYESGRGVEKDASEAVKWYYKAAEGFEKVYRPEAYYRLAICYLHGKGVERNVLAATKWWFKWFETCHTIACQNIGFVLIVAFFVAVVLFVNKWRRKVVERRRRNTMGEKEGLKETASQGDSIGTFDSCV